MYFQYVSNNNNNTSTTFFLAKEITDENNLKLLFLRTEHEKLSEALCILTFEFLCLEFMIILKFVFNDLHFLEEFKKKL